MRILGTPFILPQLYQSFNVRLLWDGTVYLVYNNNNNINKNNGSVCLRKW